MTTFSVAQKTSNVASQAAAMRFVLGILLSILSGAMLLFSFPPYGLWFLMWVSLVPYLFAQYRLMPFKWSRLAAALANLVWLGPFLARLFGTEIGFFFTYMGVWIAILNLFTSKCGVIPRPERHRNSTDGFALTREYMYIMYI